MQSIFMFTVLFILSHLIVFIITIRMCHVCCIAVVSEEECQVHLNAKRRQFGKYYYHVQSSKFNTN